MLNAIIFGSTGLVGTTLVDLILPDQYDRIFLIQRNPSQQLLDIVKGNNLANKIEFISFEDFLDKDQKIKPHHYYCSLGTTIKKAGSKKAFINVDHNLVIKTMKKSLSLGATKFCIVSALGADHNSKIFYNKIKGQMEKEALKFKAYVAIVRPSIIEGDRKEFRILESITLKAMKVLNHLLIGRFKKYRSTSVEAIARAMIELNITGQTKQDIEWITNQNNVNEKA